MGITGTLNSASVLSDILNLGSTGSYTDRPTITYPLNKRSFSAGHDNAEIFQNSPKNTGDTFDGERETAYDCKSPIGQLGKALDEAVQKGWTVVDIKKDRKRIFPTAKP